MVAAGAMTFPGLKVIAIHKGLVLEPLDMDEHGIIPDSFEKLCHDNRPRAVYIVPNIDNPTTATLPEDRREALVEIARKHRVIIIEDDPYGPLIADRSVTLAELAPDITWHIETLSKCVTPALRVAYVVAPTATSALRFAGIQRATIMMAPPLMSALASRWISEGVLDEIATAIRVENAERQKLATVAFQGLDYAADSNGHHLGWPFPHYWGAADYAQHPDRGGLAIVPSSAFAIVSHPIEAVRISLGVAPDRGDLEDGLTLLASLISQPSLGAKAVV